MSDTAQNHRDFTHIMFANPDQRIVVGGREYHFERDYAGCPWLLNRRDEPTRIPGPRHPFWQGFNRWDAQGERMDGDRCVWSWDE